MRLLNQTLDEWPEWRLKIFYQKLEKKVSTTPELNRCEHLQKRNMAMMEILVELPRKEPVIN